MGRPDESGPRWIHPVPAIGPLPTAEPLEPARLCMNERQSVAEWCRRRRLYPESEMPTSEIATFIGIKASSVQQQRHHGIGPQYRRVGSRTCLYRVSDTLAWMESVPRHARRARMLRSILEELRGFTLRRRPTTSAPSRTDSSIVPCASDTDTADGGPPTRSRETCKIDQDGARRS